MMMVTYGWISEGSEGDILKAAPLAPSPLSEIDSKFKPHITLLFGIV